MIMNRKINIILGILLISANFSCFDGGSTSGPKGAIEVTVTTSADIWNYPKPNGSDYEAYSGDTLYTWQYSEVGGNDTVNGVEYNLSNQVVPFPENAIGNKINYIYLYSALTDSANTSPVLYKGSSSVNGSAITITGVEPGEYYVVAFYDYATGGNLENILNRYDRYSIYSATDGLDGDSTPYKDKATTVTVTANQTKTITLTINRDWILGKPKTVSGGGGVGRLFLQSTDSIPTPD